MSTVYNVMESRYLGHHFALFRVLTTLTTVSTSTQLMALRLCSSNGRRDNLVSHHVLLLELDLCQWDAVRIGLSANNTLDHRITDY